MGAYKNVERTLVGQWQKLIAIATLQFSDRAQVFLEQRNMKRPNQWTLAPHCYLRPTSSSRFVPLHPDPPVHAWCQVARRMEDSKDEGAPSREGTVVLWRARRSMNSDDGGSESSFHQRKKPMERAWPFWKPIECNQLQKRNVWNVFL